MAAIREDNTGPCSAARCALRIERSHRNRARAGRRQGRALYWAGRRSACPGPILLQSPDWLQLSACHERPCTWRTATNPTPAGSVCCCWNGYSEWVRERTCSFVTKSMSATWECSCTATMVMMGPEIAGATGARGGSPWLANSPRTPTHIFRRSNRPQSRSCLIPYLYFGASPVYGASEGGLVSHDGQGLGTSVIGGQLTSAGSP